VKIHFPVISRSVVRLKTDELDICNGEMVEIAPESWVEVIGTISLIIVAESPEPLKLGDMDNISPNEASRLHFMAEGVPGAFYESTYNSKIEIFPTQGKITISIRKGSGEHRLLVVKRSARIASIAKVAASLLGISDSRKIGLKRNHPISRDVTSV
jgi:hypothetical protein